MAERLSDAELVRRFRRSISEILDILPVHLQIAYPEQAREAASLVFRLAGTEPPTQEMIDAVDRAAYRPVKKLRRARARTASPAPEGT